MNGFELFLNLLVSLAETYPELSQASKMELLPKICNGFQSINIFAKSPILDF